MDTLLRGISTAIPASDPAQLFEQLAEATWGRVRYGEELQCSQSEEMLTNIDLLEMKRARLWTVAVRKETNASES